jgi:hypothetical protein
MTSYSRDDREVTFDSIFILELLGPGDERTGLNLFRTVLEPRGLSHHLHTSHTQLHHHSQVIPSLWNIHAECTRRRLSPILHFETHGTTEGVGLDPSTLVPWDALVPPLRAINLTSEMNLVVTLAACHGLSFVRALNPLEPAPVWAMFGPNEQVFQSEVDAGFGQFYSTLLDTRNLSQAVSALRSETWLPEAWLLRSAEFFFSVVYGRVLEETSRPGERKSRERRLVTRIRRKARKTPGAVVPDDIRRRLREDINDHEAHFRRYKRRFFMIDQFPDIEHRFPLTREDCLKTWAAQRAAYEATD